MREGFIADLLVVNGNPLENLKLLNPYGADVMLLNGTAGLELHAARAGRSGAGVRGGGIEWTIKDGIPYHVPTLMREVKEMVAERAASASTRPPGSRKDQVPGSRFRSGPRPAST